MKEIVLIGQEHLKNPLIEHGFEVSSFNSLENVVVDIHGRKDNGDEQPHAILCELDAEGQYKNLISFVKSQSLTVPVVAVAQHHTQALRAEAFRAGAADYFTYGLNMDDLTDRLDGLDKWTQPTPKSVKKINYQMPRGKRLFDIAVSAGLLLMLSPLFITIALIIKLTSKGPVFYSSPRVGTGYKVFPFYKFRSMRVNADQMLKDMKHLNHYEQKTEKEEKTTDFNTDSPMLFSDEGYLNEEEFLHQKKHEEKQAFVKIQNDPRITKIGHFIRKTSIDELPQLLNVLLGHMSIVGNRPLPLYEAEKLTSDMWAMRFMAPAGITGLWQVTERGKASTSEDSRKMLDMIYAENYSIWMDLKILIKTPLAAIQQEKV